MPGKHFSKQQKIGLSVLALVTLLIMVLWYLQLQKSLVYPLYGGLNPATLNDTAASQTASDQSNKDTDKDGLTDYQEINIYHTSPYLPDTDGDGLSDKQEVDAGTDPNCPQGKVCNGQTLPATGESVSAPLFTNASGTAPVGGLNLSVLDQLGQPSTSQASGNTNSAGLTPEQIATLKQAFGDNPDPKLLRQKFIDAATTDADKQKISQLTDEKLLQVYLIMISSN